MNNLDPEVAEDPDALVVYGGTGRAARSWDGVRRDRPRAARASPTTRRCSSRAASRSASFRTHEWAPRVLIANSNLVGKWATWDVFRELERAGLTMYGQMTAGSWIYIGTQGILQGTYETFAELARQHFGGTLRGRVVLTAGPRRDGRRPAAGGDHERRASAWRSRSTRRGRRRRLDIGYVDRLTDVAGRGARAGRGPRRRPGRPLSIALVGNAAEIEPDLVRARASASTSSPTRRRPTTRSAATSRPRSRSPTRWPCARAQPDVYVRRSMRSMADHVRAMLAFQAAGVDRLRLRQQPAGAGAGRRRRGRLRLPGLRAGLHPAAVLRGPRARSAGPRCRAIRPTSPRPIGRSSSSSRTTPACAAGSRWPRRRVPFQGLPARICWLGYGERARAGAGVQRARPDRARSPRRSSSGATTSTRARSPHPTARRRRCATAPTRSPTGRSSTRSSTPPPARPGSRSTTAAGRGSATPSTPGWWSSPTAPSSPRASSSGS